MKNSGTRPQKSTRRRKPTPGEEIIQSVEQVIAWAKGADLPVRMTTVEVPATDVRVVRRRLKLSQTQFAVKFGFAPATLRNWEQGEPFRMGLRACCWR